MAGEGSITRWIDELRAGNPRAAQELWNRYYTQLVDLCRRRLASFPRRASDEEDVALSAFNSFYQGVQRGQFPELFDRERVWRLLMVIATRKAIDHIHHEARRKRGSGKVHGDSAFAALGQSGTRQGIDQVIGDQPTPERAVLAAEHFEQLLAGLDDAAREVATLKLEGYTNEEIAVRLDRSLRTVERKLWMIRTKWAWEAPRHG